MRLDVPQKKVGEVEQEWIDNLLARIDEEDWFVDNYRKHAGGMYHCDTIPFIHTVKCGSMTQGPENIQIQAIGPRPMYEKYADVVQPFYDRLMEIYPKTTKLAMFMARLAPRQSIGGHCDSSLFGIGCHRIHIPLKTNPDVEYVIADSYDHESNQGNGRMTSYYWEAGNVYEFSNEKWHEVHNNSDEWRIHIVANAYELTEEEINTPIDRKGSMELLYKYANVTPDTWWLGDGK